MDAGDTRTHGAPPLPRDRDQLVAVAQEQGGLVTRAQCFSAGLTAKAIEVRLRRGTWRRVHRSVYLTVPGRDDWWTAATAAHLACGPDAAWSHRSAAYVWGLQSRPPREIDVLIPDGRRIATPAGVRLHRSRHLDQRCDPLVWPWRTTVADTILDLADAGTVDEMYALLGAGFQRHLVSEPTLLARLGERRAHRHRGLLQSALGDASAGAESALEIRYLRDVERAHRLPVGRRQAAAWSGSGLRLRDVTYDEQRLVVELDGRLGHDQAGDRMKDGRRDRDGAVTGWLTVRAFWPDVASTPCRLAQDIGAVLRTRGWSSMSRRCRRPDCAVAA